MKKLNLYCVMMLCLIIACVALLIFLPGWLAKDEYQPPEETVVTSDCFEKLANARASNPDVYAWLHVSGTNLDYPIVQSPTSDAFYEKRNVEGKLSLAGSIMTEHSYNSTAFDDPVTVVFGNCMKSGAMFGELQSFYSSENGLEDYRTIEIYLPEQKLEYEVFAAVPYDGIHILSQYDFSVLRHFNTFFKEIASIRSFNARVLVNEKPEYGDKVLILSTTLKGDSQKCYLVMAKLK